MYRPSMYNKHDESMYTFAELFNNCKVCNDVIMKPNDEETYGKDCIQIAIQCDSTETGIAVGWHEDWLVEAKENRSLQ